MNQPAINYCGCAQCRLARLALPSWAAPLLADAVKLLSGTMPHVPTASPTASW